MQCCRVDWMISVLVKDMKLMNLVQFAALTMRGLDGEREKKQASYLPGIFTSPLHAVTPQPLT